jgi:hypothetical protein
MALVRLLGLADHSSLALAALFLAHTLVAQGYGGFSYRIPMGIMIANRLQTKLFPYCNQRVDLKP